MNKPFATENVMRYAGDQTRRSSAGIMDRNVVRFDSEGRRIVKGLRKSITRIKRGGRRWRGGYPQIIRHETFERWKQEKRIIGDHIRVSR